MRQTTLGKLAIGLALCGISLGSAAAKLPDTATIVIGFSAGGSTDATARIIAEELRQETGTNFIVENKTGAAGRLAIEQTRRAPADGSMLMIVPHGPMTLFRHIYKDLSFDPFKDFTPISRITNLEYGLVAGNNVPVENADQLKAWAQKHGDETNFGSPGTGTIPHFIGELIGRRVGVSLTHVPYRGAAPTMADIMGGTLALGVVPSADALQLDKAGKLKVVATAGAERSPLSPDIPTLREVGIDYTLTGWYAMYGPAGMDPALVQELNSALSKILKKPTVVEKLANLGLAAASTTPEGLTAIQRDEDAVWEQVIKDTGFKPLD